MERDADRVYEENRCLRRERALIADLVRQACHEAEEAANERIRHSLARADAILSGDVLTEAEVAQARSQQREPEGTEVRAAAEKENALADAQGHLRAIAQRQLAAQTGARDMRNNRGGYEVKNVKTFEGREGYGYNATLYRDGKRIARVIDDASGGEIDTCFTSKDEDARLTEFCAKLPPEDVSDMYNDGGKHTLDVSPGMFIDNLVQDYEVEREEKSAVKKGIAIRFVGDKEGTYRLVKCALGKQAAMREAVIKKYGTTIAEVINDKYADYLAVECARESATMGR